MRTVLQEGSQCKVVADPGKVHELMLGFAPGLVLIEYLLPGVNDGVLCGQLKKREDMPISR